MKRFDGKVVLKHLLLFLSFLFLLGGCTQVSTLTTTVTTYKEPSYYQTNRVPKKYVAGKTYQVSDLRCLSTKENCHTALKSREDARRKYPKPYLFY